MKRITPLYAALDQHTGQSVLSSMDHEGRTQPRVRFATQPDALRFYVGKLRQTKRALYLTMEAGALTRWASGIVRPLVDRLIVCEPRHNRLINSNPTKSDEADVEGMCLLLRLSQAQRSMDGNRSHPRDLPGAGLRATQLARCAERTQG